MAGWTVVPNQNPAADTSAWKPVKPPTDSAQAPQPQEGFWESLGHTFGFGKEEAAAYAKEIQDHPLRAALKNPLTDAIQAAASGFMRSTGELGQSVDALRDGNPAAAGVHAVQAVPFVGPAIQHGADQLQPGQSINPGEVGTALGTAVQTAPMALGFADSAFPNRPAIPNPVSAVGNAVKPLLTGDVNAPIPGSEPPLTPAARYTSMKAMGVQPNAAEATSSPVLKGAEDLNENSLTAAGTYTKARATNLAALKGYTNDVLNKMSPAGPDASAAALNQSAERVLDTMSPLGREEGGAAVRQALLKSHADLKTGATEAYKDLDEQVGGQPLPGTAGLREQAQAILDANAPYYKAHPELEPTKAMAIVRDLAGTKGAGRPAPKVIPGFGPAAAAPEVGPPPDLTYTELHRLRSDLLDFNNTNPDLVKNQANGWISQLAGAADNAITSGESALTPDQVETFRNANDAWKFMKATYDNPAHPFYQAVRTSSPSTLVDGIAKTPEMAKMLQTVLGSEEIGPIQRGVAENLLKTTKEGGYNFNTFQGQWNKLKPEYRETLFSPEQRQQLEDIGNAGTVLHESLNPGGISALGSAISKTPGQAEALEHSGVLGPGGMGPIQRGVALNLLGTTKEGGYNFKTFQGQWNKLPQAYREALFTPEQRQQLQDIGNAGTVLHEDVNPSGSARLGQRMAEMGEGGASIGTAATGHLGALAGTGVYHGAQFALSKFMNSPTFVDWLMKDQGARTALTAPSMNRMIPAAVASGAMTSGWDFQNNRPKDAPAAIDRHTGPDGQPNFYSDAYLRGKAEFDAARAKE